MPPPKRRSLKQSALTQKVLDLPAPDNQATGDTWKPSKVKPATLPLANDVTIREVYGPYTETDRKLWVLLVHAAWDKLHLQTMHEAKPSQINALFKEIRGQAHDKGSFEIWQSIRRLTKTSLDFVDDQGGEYSTNLINAKLLKSTDQLYYGFPEPLLDLILANKKFSRLRLHFMIGLSGKYAVSLYIALERVVNLRKPILDVTIKELRALLQVPEGKMQRWVDLKRFGVNPAIAQINEGADQGGFIVEMEEITVGRGVERVQFSVKKTGGRIQLEEKLIGKKSKSSSRLQAPFDTNKALAAIRQHAPGMDAHALLHEWKSWSDGKPAPLNPMGALVNFAKKKFEENKHHLR